MKQSIGKTQELMVFHYHFLTRTYPKTSIYCDRLQRPRPALSAKNVLSVQQARLRAFFTCRLGLDLFARSRDETGFGKGSKYWHSDKKGFDLRIEADTANQAQQLRREILRGLFIGSGVLASSSEYRTDWV